MSPKIMFRVGWGSATLALVSIALVVVSAASATAPGRNGSIVFRRYFDDQQTWGAVFTIEPDGTHARQLTHPPQGVVDDGPTWAPDGSLISFTRCAPPDGTCHVWTVAPDGTGIAPVGSLCPTGAKETSCPDDGSPDFSPDSKQLAFVQSTGRVEQVPVTGQQIEHSAIAVMNRDGSNRHVIYTTNGFTADLDYPIFSPDGKQIVFERHNSGLSRPVDKHAVFVINLDGSNLHRLTPWAENDGDNPDWSPDGKWILYHSHLDDPSGQAQYFLVHPDGSARTQITHFPSGTHIASAAFSPDGSSIVFSKGPENGNIDLYTMHVDGTRLQRVTRSKLWDSAPEWGPARSSGLRKLSAAGTFPAGAWRVNEAASFTVKATLDDTSRLPHRVHWIARPSLPSSQIREVDFLIDGKLRWVEHQAPYYYGSDGDWLVTSFLTPGMHRFAVRAKATDGRTATDVHPARVTGPDPLPSGIAGSWHRQIGADIAGADLAGTWSLRINSVGWSIVDPTGAPSLIDVAYIGSDLLASRGPIWTAPMGPPGSPTEGNGWCDAPFPSVRYRYTTTATTLTLQLVGNDHCGGEHGIWAGTWSRSQ